MGEFKRIKIAVIACLALFLCACSGGSKFEIDGQLLNMNQGTIYVYSSTGHLHKIDTVQIAAGRFQYSRAMESKGTLVLVFPNFSEVPVFAEPGEDVTLKGNAQQLKKLTISGTDANELMTRFRLETSEQTPPQVLETATKYIKEHASSPVAVWLLEKHFLNVHNADIAKVIKLAKAIQQNQKDNGRLAEMIASLESMKTLKKGCKLPKFSAKDIDGKTIDNESLKGKKTIIFASAAWDYNSEVDRNVRMIIGDQKYNFRAVKVSIDASKDEAKRNANYYPEHSDIRVICDERMFNSPIMRTFGFSKPDDNIILDGKGKIIGVNVMPSQISEKLK